jgi:serine/threonine protein phosphatase PrpC
VAGDGRERLAFTRAIGDFNMKRYGVSAEPTVATDIPPPPSGVIRVVVVASDGLWDACHYREVAEAIQKSLGAGVSVVAALLLAIAEDYSTDRFGEVHDNISIAVAVIRG